MTLVNKYTLKKSKRPKRGKKLWDLHKKRVMAKNKKPLKSANIKKGRVTIKKNKKFGGYSVRVNKVNVRYARTKAEGNRIRKRIKRIQKK